MNTKEVCKQFSVTPKMLRIYEEQEMIRAKRSDNNYRDYALEDILSIKVIKVLRELGFSLSEIKLILKIGKFEDKDYALINSFYIQLKAIEMRMKELNLIKLKLKDSINDILQKSFIEDDFYQLILKCCQTTGDTGRFEKFIEIYNFDEMAADYVNRFLKDDEEYQVAIEKAREIIVNFNPSGKILDIGGGTGYLWKAVENRDYNLTIMDKSLNMLMFAQKNIPWARCVLEDVLELGEQRRERYDLVVSTFMLHHIEYEKHSFALSEMLRLCKPEGTILIVDRGFFNETDREAMFRELERSGNCEQVRIIKQEYYLNMEKMIQYLEQCGCSVTYKSIGRAAGSYIIKPGAGEIL